MHTLLPRVSLQKARAEGNVGGQDAGARKAASKKVKIVCFEYKYIVHQKADVIYNVLQLNVLVVEEQWGGGQVLAESTHEDQQELSVDANQDDELAVDTMEEQFDEEFEEVRKGSLS
jgi:hypothetical protein